MEVTEKMKEDFESLYMTFGDFGEGVEQLCWMMQDAQKHLNRESGQFIRDLVDARTVLKQVRKLSMDMDSMMGEIVTRD